MAGQADTKSSQEGKSINGGGELSIFNAENLQSNMKSIYYSRTFLSIVGGVIAGIWGFTGLSGFIFYFLIMAVTSLGLLAKAKFSVVNYFDSWNRIILDGFFGGLMSFVLFWTRISLTQSSDSPTTLFIYSETGKPSPDEVIQLKAKRHDVDSHVYLSLAAIESLQFAFQIIAFL